MKTNILVLAAGHASFDTEHDSYPPCLSEMDGVSLCERIVANARNIPNAQFTFTLRKQDITDFHLDKVVSLLAPGAQVVTVANGTRGSACTALLAATQFNANDELLVVSANELVDIDFARAIAEFRTRNLDAGALTFSSIHPRYSYVRINNENLVTEAAQQNPISRNATAGVFWFASAGTFVDAAKNLIRKDQQTRNNFYIAPAFNEIILKQGRVGVAALDPKHYFPLKTERQIHHFEQGGGAA